VKSNSLELWQKAKEAAIATLPATQVGRAVLVLWLLYFTLKYRKHQGVTYGQVLKLAQLGIGIGIGIGIGVRSTPS
jgi:hypothetical protein